MKFKKVLATFILCLGLGFASPALATPSPTCQAASDSLYELTHETTSIVCATPEDREAIFGRGRTNIGGWYLPDKEIIYVMDGYEYEFSRHIILHEYGHHLDRQAGKRMAFPTWFATDTRPDMGIEWFAEAFLYLYTEGGPGLLTAWNPPPTDAQMTELQTLGWLPTTVPDEQIERLYQAYFKRSPDPVGMKFWKVQRYVNRRSLDDVSFFFATSDEFIQQYGSLEEAEFVQRVYMNVLGRQPDQSGLTFWTSQITSGTKTRGEVMVGFSESREFIMRQD